MKLFFCMIDAKNIYLYQSNLSQFHLLCRVCQNVPAALIVSSAIYILLYIYILFNLLCRVCQNSLDTAQYCRNYYTTKPTVFITFLNKLFCYQITLNS